jgi:hypothetical protein
VQQEDNEARRRAREACDALLRQRYARIDSLGDPDFAFEQRITILRDYITKLWGEFQAGIASLRQEDEGAIEKTYWWTPSLAASCSSIGPSHRTQSAAFYGVLINRIEHLKHLSVISIAYFV